MSFFKSMLFGYEESYNILGIQVKFEKQDPSNCRSNLKGAGLISEVAIKCINNNLFRWITLGYAHVFVHEMSHALTYKLFTNQNPTLRVYKNSCTGETYLSQPLTDWKKTIIFVAGPMGDVAFCTIKLVAATALKSYLSWPIALAIGSGSVMWMSGELLYAYTSALKKDSGDFGGIASFGNTHLALATVALVSQVALGIFAAIKLAA